MFTTPPSSNTTPTRNSGLSYITSTVHQSPFRGVNQWGTLVIAPTFAPSSYIPLQAVTSTPIYTMEVNSSFRRIEKFSKRLNTISLKEFKATFSNVVCELELKYGANYIETFTFKQLAHYVHYEALDVYEQHLMSTSNILWGFFVSSKSPIQLMPQPPPPPFKLHCKLPLHIMGLCLIIQIQYLLQ